ncbi:MAG: glycosyltransferase [Cyanobacteria bacterium P01_D01_bin.115]
MTSVLFLDQSGNLGGAELCLLDIAYPHRQTSLVGLFKDGPFKAALESKTIPVQILSGSGIQVRKDSSLIQALQSLFHLGPCVSQAAKIAASYELIYANTQKALVVGALASLLSGRPLVYHLHDIVTPDHFSPVNRRLIVTLANRVACQIIATSEAARSAFVEAGGNGDKVTVVYNGFNPSKYHRSAAERDHLRQKLGLEGKFVIGHFSRLAPWKGQDVLLDALQHCDGLTQVLLVGAALYGEDDYVDYLHQQAKRLGISDRVQFLGFRDDVPALMAACDLVTHTSTAPEPFGRVVAEAMLSQRPVIAAAAGGIVELIESGENGWLVPPNQPRLLAEAIQHCFEQPKVARTVARTAYSEAVRRFHVAQTTQQIVDVLEAAMADNEH